MVVLPDPRFPKKMYVSLLGLKCCRSECSYNDIVSISVFSAVLSVNGLRARPYCFNKLDGGMVPSVSARAHKARYTTAHLLGEVRNVSLIGRLERSSHSLCCAVQ